MAEIVKIKDLSMDKHDIVVIAMLIFFREPREMKAGGRGVWNVTLRDQEDTINMSVWADLSVLNEYLKNFTFGDVVEIHSPKLELQRDSDKDYRPDVTSPCTLSLNHDSKCKMMHWNAPPEEIAAWAPLLSIPTKPPQSYTKVSDLYQMSKPAPGEKGKLLNLLVTVGSVSDMMTGKSTSSGQQNKYRCINLFDYAGPTESLLLFARGTLADRANSWIPKETVLFIADAQISQRGEESRATIIISLHFKSIVTENPSIEDAEWVRQAAAASPADHHELMQNFVATIRDLSTVRNIMTINTLKSKCVMITTSKGREGGVPTEPAFTGMMYVAIIGFDIDDPKDRILKPTCKVCKTKLSSYDAQCYSVECVDRSDRFTEATFDLRVNLADHTGELRRCLLQGDAAQGVLNCTAEEFDQATEAEISALKWHFLLERVVARVAVVSPLSPKGKILVSILSLELASPFDVAQHIPMH